MVVPPGAGELDVVHTGADKELLRHPYVFAGRQVHPSALPDPENGARQPCHHHGVGGWVDV